MVFGKKFFAIFYFLILTLPLGSSLHSISFVGNVSAAGGCTATDPPLWDENVANATLEYHDWGYFEERDSAEKGKRYSDELYSVSSNVGSVDPLENGFHVSKVLENGTSSGIRINLTTGYTYTFCITTKAHNSTTAAPIDVYLITESDWDYYEWSYTSAVNDWAEEFDLSTVPPEWRGGFSWRPFRDVHAYENLNEITFSTALDTLETRVQNSWSGSGNVVTDEFYLVVDGWDNGRDSDAPDPNIDIDLDMTIMVEERVTVPTWTVTIVCLSVMISLLAVPVVFHKRYHNVGLVKSSANLMPGLETVPDTSTKDYSVLE